MFIDLMTPRNELIDWVDGKIFALKMKGYNFNKEQVRALTILFICTGSNALAAGEPEVSSSPGVNGFYSIIFSTLEILKGLSLKDLESIKLILTKGK